MSLVRSEAIAALVTAIRRAVPTLEVVSGQPLGTGKKLCLPSLAVHGTRFRYFPEQEMEYGEPDPDQTTMVVQVGNFEATLQLILATATTGERYHIEQRLTEIFMADEDRPGVLLTTVSSDPELGQFLAAFELDEDEWRDEKAFDAQPGSVLTVQAEIPALVRRRDVYTTNELGLALTEDFATAFSEGSLVPPRVEAVRVNQDGSIS